MRAQERGDGSRSAAPHDADTPRVGTGKSVVDVTIQTHFFGSTEGIVGAVVEYEPPRALRKEPIEVDTYPAAEQAEPSNERAEVEDSEIESGKAEGAEQAAPIPMQVIEAAPALKTTLERLLAENAAFITAGICTTAGSEIVHVARHERHERPSLYSITSIVTTQSAYVSSQLKLGDLERTIIQSSEHRMIASKIRLRGSSLVLLVITENSLMLGRALMLIKDYAAEIEGIT